MTTSKIKAAPVPRLNAAARKAFLAHLSQTANVSASARAIDVGTPSIYAERARSPEFRAQWTIALAEGYARLEAEMLCEALKAASATTSDAMLKSRAQKDRLRLSLLQMHRALVKAVGSGAATASVIEHAATSRMNLITKLFKMRSSVAQKPSGSGSGSGRKPECDKPECDKPECDDA